MAHRSEPPVSPYPTLQLNAGHPGTSEVHLRVSPEHAQELRDCLEAEQIHVADVLELSTGAWLAILAVTLPAAALGARSAFAAAITKFLDRHKGKKVTFGVSGNLETAEGYSANDVMRMLDRVNEQQRELDRSWDAIRGENRTADDETPEG